MLRSRVTFVFVLMALAAVLTGYTPATAQSPYTFIDFETVQGSPPNEGDPIGVSYPAVEFKMLNNGIIGDAIWAEAGAPGLAFSTGFNERHSQCFVTALTNQDMPRVVDQPIVDCYFLADNVAVTNGPCTLRVSYRDGPVTEASGVLMDVEATEWFEVEPRFNGAAAGTKKTYDLSDGGDGQATYWCVEADIQAQFDTIYFVFNNGTNLAVGYAFDNFCPDYIGSEITGMVFDDSDADGSPTGEIGYYNYEVMISGIEYGGGVITPYSEFTNYDGRYAFSGLKPGEYQVTIQGPGWVGTQTHPTTVYYELVVPGCEIIYDIDFGISDCIGDPPCPWSETHDDPADEYIDTELSTYLSGLGTVQSSFGAPIVDAYFGHTFSLPDRSLGTCVITEARLQIAVEADQDTPDDDFLQIGQWTAPGAGQVWYMTLSQLDNMYGNGGGWNTGDQMVIDLDLKDLPMMLYVPCTDVLALLNGPDNDFDIVISDDTRVHWIRLDIKYCCQTQCVIAGDIDGDGLPLTTADLIMLLNFVQMNPGYTVPPVLYECDLNNDGYIDQLDVDKFAEYNAIGLSAFPQYPIPACCVVDTVRGACCTEVWDPPVAYHFCDVLSEYNCAQASGDYSADGADCDPFPCPLTICCRLRGDVNHDYAGPDIADLVYMVNYMFGGGPGPVCPMEIDINGDGNIGDIADLVYLVGYMFSGGPPPAPCP